MKNKNNNHNEVRRANNGAIRHNRGRKVMSNRLRLPVLNGASGWMTGSSENPEEKYRIRAIKYQYNGYTLRSLGKRFNVSQYAVRDALKDESSSPVSEIIRAYVDGLEMPYFGGQGAQ